MAKASSTLRASARPAIVAAAAEIHALINSQPRSPTKDELAAIIAKVALRVLPAGEVGKSKQLPAEWNAAMAACRVAEEMASDEEVSAASERVDDCMRQIWSEPVHGLADIMLVAEACYWALWTDPQGLRGPDADVRLADGPDNCGPVCDEALAALFRAIRRVVDAGPPGP